MADQTTVSADYQFLAVGRERFVSDKRQLGGLLLLLGTCATFQPLATISSLMGVNETGASTPLERSALAAGFIQIAFGTLGMVTGYLSLVHDYGHKYLSGALIVLTQLAWMPYLIGMIEIGIEASAPYVESTRTSISQGQFIVQLYVDNPWIPDVYLPTEKDVRFFGAMGILGVLSYGFAFLGSFAFVAFALFEFDEGKPMLRDARYFRSRLLMYTTVLTIAGVSQLLLGSYVIFEFGSGQLSPSMGVAMFRVHFPEMTVMVGLLQMLVGYFGMARYIGWVSVGPNNHSFQALLLLQWVSMLVLQYIIQIGYSPGSEHAETVPSLALLSVGLNVLPAFLDYKMRTTPEFLTNEYYGIASDGKQSTMTDTAPRGFEDLESIGSLPLGSNANPIHPDAKRVTLSLPEDGYAVSNQTMDNDIEGAEPTIDQPREVDTELHSELFSQEAPHTNNMGRVDGFSLSSALDDDDDSEVGREPSARLGSRSIDRNALTNELYKHINQSQMTRVKSNKSVDRHDDDDCREPSARLDSRSIDPNEIANQLYDHYNDRMEPDDVIPLNDTVTSTEASSKNDTRRNSQLSLLSGLSDDRSHDGYSQPSAYSYGADTQPSSHSDVRSYGADTQPSTYSDGRSYGADTQPSAYSDYGSRDGYSQPSAYSGANDYNEPEGRRDLYSDAGSRDGYSQPSLLEPPVEHHSPVRSIGTSIDSDEFTSESPIKEDPPERSTAFSDDNVVREMYGRISRDPEEEGITRFESYDDPGDLSDDSPDDSTAVLEEKLDEIEKELFTDSMESFHNSLANLL